MFYVAYFYIFYIYIQFRCNGCCAGERYHRRRLSNGSNDISFFLMLIHLLFLLTVATWMWTISATNMKMKRICMKRTKSSVHVEHRRNTYILLQSHQRCCTSGVCFRSFQNSVVLCIIVKNKIQGHRFRIFRI